MHVSSGVAPKKEVRFHFFYQENKVHVKGVIKSNYSGKCQISAAADFHTQHLDRPSEVTPVLLCYHFYYYNSYRLWSNAFKGGQARFWKHLDTSEEKKGEKTNCRWEDEESTRSSFSRVLMCAGRGLQIYGNLQSFTVAGVSMREGVKFRGSVYGLCRGDGVDAYRATCSRSSFLSRGVMWNRENSHFSVIFSLSRHTVLPVFITIKCIKCFTDSSLTLQAQIVLCIYLFFYGFRGNRCLWLTSSG